MTGIWGISVLVNMLGMAGRRAVALGAVAAVALGLATPAFAQVTNTATVAAPAGITDANTANNSATDSDTLLKPVTVTKTVTGAPATGAPGTYGFSLACGTPTATYTGSITLSGAATTGNTTVNIPAGSTGCTLTETARPTEPTGYTWAAATYTQPPSPIPASGAVTAQITNPLTSPVINAAKTAGTVSGPDSGGVYTVTYTVTVTNSGSAAGTYGTLADSPVFPANTAITGATWTTSGAGAPTGGSSTAAGPYNLAPAATPISAGVTHTFSLAVTYRYTSSATPLGCASPSVAGSGLHNSVALPANQETNTGDNAACVAPPTPPAPVATIAVSPASVVEDAAPNLTYTVSLNYPSPTAVTIPLAYTGTATSGSDYAAGPASVTIPAGATSVTFTIDPTVDTVDEPNETVIATIGAGTGYTVGTPASATGTITDDDLPSASIIVNPAVVNEDGATNLVYTVALSSTSPTPTTVNLTASGTAISGTDYTGAITTIVIPANTLSATFTIDPTADTVDEADETVVFTIGTGTGYTVGAPASATGTITDDDNAPTLTINDVSVNEAAGTATFTVTLSSASGQTVSVNYATAGNTATPGTDFTTTSGTLTFAPGTLTQAVTVSIVNDVLDEIDETYFVNLSTPTNATIADPQGLGTIVDNDDPSFTINDVSVNEAAGTATFTVTLSASPAAAATVNFATANNTALAGSDYTSTSGTLTFAAGTTTLTQAITVPIANDAVDEVDETYFVNLSGATNATIADNQGLGTIVDNDDPSFTINDVSVNEAAGTATFTVTLSASPAAAATVNFATANNTALAGSDYTATSGTLTFAAGTTTLTQTITVPIVNDTVDEVDETYFVNLSGATNATIADNQGLGTIVDNDDPSFTINDVSVNEAAGTATFTVTLSGTPAAAASVAYASADNTALAGSDYTAVSGTLTFAAGTTTLTQTITVPITNDLVFEGNETYFINLTAPTNATIADPQGLGTITDDDNAPTISINDVTVAEGAGNATLTVSLSNPAGTPVTVTLNTANATATAGADYTAQTNVTVTIPAGATSATVTIPILQDAIDEADETFNAVLTNPSANATIADNTGVVTITDDDNAPSLTINDVSVNEAAGTATFTVTLSAASGQAVTVAYASANDTATAGADYTAVSGTLTFAPGTLTQTITVPIANDTVFEGNETYFINLTAPTNATVADAQGLGTILDDDNAPAISIDDVTVVEGAGAVLTVSLSNPSASAVTVVLNTANGTAVAPGDYTAQANVTVTIAAGATSATVTIPTTQDATFEPTETFTAVLSAPTNATIADGTGVVTITDDDASPVATIAVSPASVDEDGATNLTYTVTLSNPSATAVTIPLTYTGTATSGTDYAAGPASVTIPAGATSATFVIDATTDTIDEADETVIATIGAGTGYTVGTPASATGTILDDDNAPTVTVGNASATEGTALVHTVTLSNASANATTYPFALADGTAVAPGDYTNAPTFSNGVTLTGGNISVPAGVTSFTVTYPSVQDAIDEADETTTLTIGGSTGTGTILDDDDAPTLSINDVTVAENVAGGNATLTVTLSAVSGQAVTVVLATANGSATAGSDYTAQTSVTVTIPAGATTATVLIPILDDTVSEPTETFNVNLTAPTNATIADAQGVVTITDDDAVPTIAVGNATAPEGADLVHTVTLSNASASATTYAFSLSDGTAVAPGDYTNAPTFSNGVTLAGGIITVPAGVTSFTVTYPSVQDTIDEADETTTLTIGGSTGTGTIADDDDAPVATIAVSPASVSEDGATNLTYTVTLSNPSATAVTIPLTYTGSATSGTDYAAGPASVTIPAGATSATFAIDPTTDTVDEADETVIATIGAGTGYTVGMPSSATGNILDDDNAPTVSVADATAAEGDPAAFVVSLSNPSANDVTVTFTTSTGTAGTGDYTQTTLTVTIPAGQTSVTVNVPTTEDLVDEADETFNVTLSNPVGATIGDGAAIGTITDDDDAPVATIAVSPTSVDEDGATNLTYTVTLSNPSAAAVTIPLTYTGTATSGADYAAGPASVTIPAGATSATFVIDPTTDTTDEADETVIATIGAGTGYTVGTPASATGNILDDDNAPTVTVGNASATEGTALVHTVTLSNASANATTYPFALADGTAVAPGDYTNTPTFSDGVTLTGGNISVPAGVTSFTVTYPSVQDAIDEADETTTLTIGGSTGTGTITDDDDAPTVSVADATALEGDPAAFVVSLSNPSANDVTVTFTTSTGTAGTGDYTQTTLTVTIPAGQTSVTVNVPTTEDLIDEADETFNVTLSNPVGATIGDGTAIGTITDDDNAPVATIGDAATVNEGGNLVYTVTLSNPAAVDLTIPLAYGGTATGGADYAAGPASVTIPAGQTTATVTLATTTDAVAEGNETATVTLGAGTGYTVGTPATGTGIIADVAPALTVSIGDAATVNEGGNLVYVVTLTGGTSTADIVIPVTYTGTAADGSDYTSVATVTIPAGQTTGTLTLPTLTDAVAEGSETVIANLGAPPAGVTVVDGSGTGTIADATVLTVSIGDAAAVNEGGNLVYVVTLTGGTSTTDIVIPVTYTGTASDGTDYTGVATVTIPAGQTTGTLTLPTLTDAVVEGSETVIANLGAPPAGVVIGDGSGTGTINDASVLANDDTAATPQNTPVTTNVLANDQSGQPLNPASVTVTVQSPNGTTSVDPVTGAITFTPNAGFSGTTTYTYQVCDTSTPTPVCDTAVVTVTVQANTVNAVDDTASTPQNTPVTTTVLGNDTTTGAPLNPASVTVTTPSPNGTTSIDPLTGAITFTPNAGFSGTTTYSYQVCDTSTPTPVCDTAVVTVTVQANTVNAVDDTATTPQNTPVTTTVLGNDTTTGAPLNPASVTIVTPSPNGTATVNADGSITFTPNAGFSGTTTYTYQVCDTSTPTPVCDTATVTVTVAAAVIVAGDDTGSVASGATGGTAVPNVLVNDTVNGTPATLSTVILTQVSTTNPNVTLDAATGAVNVAPGTPAGTYTLVYRICEQANPANCQQATVTVTVGAGTIDANNDAATTGQNTAVTITVLGNDTLNGAATTAADVTVTQVNPPGNGSITVNADGTITYTPNPGFSGTDTFTYQVCENLNPANCDTATVTVTVGANSVSANDDTATVPQGGSVTTNVLGNDTTTGAPLNPASVTIATPSPNGTATVNPDGTITFVPTGGFSGTTTYTYRVCDTSTPTPVCDTAVVTVTVTGNVVNAVDDPNVTADPEVSTTVFVIGNDTTTGAPLDPASITLVTPATNGTVVCQAGSCTYTSNPGFFGVDTFSYRICDTSTPTPVCDTATVTVTVRGASSVRMTKEATPRDVRAGELVRYTLTLENTGDVTVVDATLVDTPPAGFVLVDGSLAVADANGAGRLVGSSPIRVDQIDIAIGGRATITYLLRVGAGVRGGVHVNRAQLVDNGQNVSNVASASVQMVSDPLVDESLILGTVWDDRDGDGWQDSAAMSGVQVQGGFAPNAYVAGSTTVDRGNGAEPAADASAPLLHGLGLGSIAGRQSDADPAGARRVVVSQTLTALSFTDDFVLTTKQGVTVRMDAAGNTRVQRDAGDAANGLTAAAPTVERKVSLVDGPAGNSMYRVDYVIENAGVDERGIPGVRIASVEGLIMETDQYGRYHVVGIDGGRAERGRNFILKVDPATLPPGSVFTTDNPLVRRITQGLPVRFDFGVKLPPGLVPGERREVEMKIGEVLFEPGSAAIAEKHAPVIDKMADKVREVGAGEVVITASGDNTGDSQAMAYDRAKAVQDALVARLDPADAQALKISLRADPDSERSTLLSLQGGSAVLGTVLFDTDQAAIKPEYAAVIDRLAQDIDALAGSDATGKDAAGKGRGEIVVGVVGHADKRGSDANNVQLGLRRAKAVYEAIAAKLSPEVRSKLRVEISDDPTAPVGKTSR